MNNLKLEYKKNLNLEILWKLFLFEGYNKFTFLTILSDEFRLNEKGLVNVNDLRDAWTLLNYWLLV